MFVSFTNFKKFIKQFSTNFESNASDVLEMYVAMVSSIPADIATVF